MGKKIKINGTIMQYFEWYLPRNCALWNKVSDEAKHLNDIGITAVWLPPAYKGADGNNDVGYAVYDLYNLGEFNQKGSVSTKYGTKDEYLKAIKILHKNNIQVYADISLDHMIGADEVEEVEVIEETWKSVESKKYLHGLNLILMEEIINIHLLSGIIIILME